MRSKNAEFLRKGIIEQSRRMTPAQRVKAFIEHSRLMKSVKEAGDQRRRELGKEKTEGGR